MTLYVLTDEQAVAAAEEQIERVAVAIAQTNQSHPGISIDALTQVLWLVNGVNWIGASDMSRARVLAKSRIDKWAETIGAAMKEDGG